MRFTILLVEGKGCCKGTRGTGELVNIYIQTKSKIRRNNLVIVWTDYNRAFEMIQQSRIIDCLKMYKIS